MYEQDFQIVSTQSLPQKEYYTGTKFELSRFSRFLDTQAKTWTSGTPTAHPCR